MPSGSGHSSVFPLDAALGRDLAAVDWAATPLGPPETWPTSLASTVRVMLSSRFSMWMAWGPELTFLCNDAYRRDTLGGKYPWALGRPASEVWAEIWPDIGPRIAHVMATGEATWDEALMLFLERSGFREETYHTFSYSPLTDDDGDVAGMLCVVSEDTERVVGARRMALARDLGAHVTALRSEREVLDAASAQLAAGEALLPFTATYLLDATGDAAVLAAATALPPGSPVAPERVDLVHGVAPWPLSEVLAGETVVVRDLAALSDDLPTGGWDVAAADRPARALPPAGRAPPAGLPARRAQPAAAARRGPPRLRRAARRPGRRRPRPAPGRTRRSASGPSGCSSWTGPRRPSSPTSATSSARR